MKLTSLENIKPSKVSHNPDIKKQVLLGYNEIENLTQFATAVFPPDKTAYSHKHDDMTEVFFIQSGEGTITVNDELIPLKPGTCIAVEAKEFHEITNTGTIDLKILFFGIKKEKI